MAKRCEKCNAINSLAYITSRAFDGNYVTYANGYEEQGYLPGVPGLCDSDGTIIAICIACGWLNGLDLVVLQTSLSKPNHDYT